MQARERMKDDGGVVLPSVGMALFLAALALFGWLSLRTPDVVAEGAPAEVGSGARAYRLLEALALAGGESQAPPRPVGSDAGARTRAEIVRAAETLGLVTEVHGADVVYGAEAVAGRVRNVVARLDGRGTYPGERHAIALMAHYDSHVSGPGIGDDLAGVAAILEATRALIARGPLARDLILLFTEGEEQGLLGAEAFAAQHRFADEVGVVINVEGRGASGPSRMFETGSGNGWSIAALARTARHPSATSVSREIYRRMPNGTDLSVWLERGVPGLNHAFIGDVHAYHTPLDGLWRLDRGSLQHHVDNVIDAVVALDGTPFPKAPESEADAIYFDVPGRGLVHVTARDGRIAAGAVLLLAALVAALVAQKRGPERVALGALVAALALLLIPAFGGLARALLGAAGLPGLTHPAHPGPIQLAVVALVLAAACAATLFAARRGLDSASALAGAVLVLAGGAVALGFTVTGATYLLLVPAAVLAVLGLFSVQGRFANGASTLVAIVASVGAALVWAPLGIAVVDALGTSSGLVLAAPFAVGFVALLPALVAGRGAALVGWAGLGLFVAVAAGGLAVYLPAATIKAPGGARLVRTETAEDGKFVVEGARAHAARMRAACEERIHGVALEGYANQRLAEDAPVLRVLSVAGSEMGGVVARVHVLPRAGANALFLGLAPKGAPVGTQYGPDVAGFVLDGVAVDGGRLRHATPPAEGFEVLVHAPEGAELTVVDEVPGLGGPFLAAAEPLLEARPEDLVPWGPGDRSRVRATVELALAPVAVAGAPEADAPAADDSGEPR